MMLGVSTNLGKTKDAPTAPRATSTGWRDPRLWIGVALVAASILVGVKVIGAADDTIEVWAVRSDLAKGQEVGSGDLVVKRVHLADDADLYVHADEELPDGATLERAVGAGELLPEGALGDGEEALVELVMPLTTQYVPQDLAKGDQISVWVVTRSDGGSGKPRSPEKVVGGVVVLDVPKSDDTWSFSDTQQVLIGVPAAEADRVKGILQGNTDETIQITRP